MQIVARLRPKGVLAIAEVRRLSHVERIRQGKKPGGAALALCNEVKAAIGPELVRKFPALWYYH